MHTLMAQDVLHVWEWARGRHPIERLLALLQIAFPDVTWDTLATLSIGRRNAWLLRVREQLLGPSLHALATCPGCGTLHDIELPIDVLVGGADQDASGPAPDETRHQFSLSEATIEFRLPTSRDLAAVATSLDVETARRRLAERCLVWNAPGDGPRLPLSDALVDALSEEMAMVDPCADVRLRLRCDTCADEWSTSLDLSGFLWTEVSAIARRLLRDVHTLARAYGWRESDILAMPDGRRQSYIDLVTS
jgi:hypothetical protein